MRAAVTVTQTAGASAQETVVASTSGREHQHESPMSEGTNSAREDAEDPATRENLAPTNEQEEN